MYPSSRVFKQTMFVLISSNIIVRDCCPISRRSLTKKTEMFIETLNEYYQIPKLIFDNE